MITPDNCEKQSKWVGIFDPTLYIPIIDSLSLHLTIADVLVICQVCKALGNLKDYMLKKVSNINERLRDFVNNPTLFRTKLGQYDALISGHFARSLFDLKPIKALHLDVFVCDGADAEHLAQYLEDHEGYKIDAETTSMPTSELVTYNSISRIGVRLRFTRTRGAPIHHILTSSYTTACINVVTWNKAFSMFPLDTLIKHRFYPLKPFDDGFGSRLKELAHQGWTTRNIIWPDLEDAGHSRITRLRRVGDNYSLIIPLNTSAVTRPSIPDLVIEYAQFQILNDNQPHTPWPRSTPRQTGLLGRPSRDLRSPKGSFLELHAKEMKSPGARYTYTTSSSSSGWTMYVTERLHRWAWLEIFKMGTQSTDWLTSNTFPLVSEIPNFEKPDTWDYADDQIPNWYLEWMKKARG
ncbi:hypothetical protein PGQ11_007956 [Apiospora arundinis]|uniref:F-box domain-containing protein n=1 Tax=Apiospora arundinis TaxID=335852 RepID=A0ABR2IYI7_9PEZI